jgi:hypothetical protein
MGEKGTVRYDSLGGVLARFELRSLRPLRRVGLFLPNFDVFVAWDGLLAFWLLSVCPADLDKFGLRSNLGLYARFQLGGVAIRVGALCGIWANCKSFPLARRRRTARVRSEKFRIRLTL